MRSLAPRVVFTLAVVEVHVNALVNRRRVAPSSYQATLTFRPFTSNERDVYVHQGG